MLKDFMTFDLKRPYLVWLLGAAHGHTGIMMAEKPGREVYLYVLQQFAVFMFLYRHSS